MHESFLSVLAKELDASPREVSQALQEMRRAIVEEATTHGQSHIEGLGAFEIVEDSLTFKPDEALSALVNHRYSHLEPLVVERNLPSYLASDKEDPDPALTKAEHQEESWAASLVGGDDDPLGVGSPFKEADFDVIDEQKDESTSDDSEVHRSPDETIDSDRPVEASQTKDDSGDEGKPADAPDEVRADDPSSQPGATDGTLVYGDGTDEVESTESVEHVTSPPAVFGPYYGVLHRDELVESSFVGARLERRDPVPHDKASEHAAVQPSVGDRDPARSSREGSTDRQWTKVLVASGLVVLLLVGGWILAEQAGWTDQLTGAADETEEIIAGADADEEETTPEAGEPEADADEPEADELAAAEDEPADPVGPPPIEASAGMWTIVMASEPSESAAQAQLDDLWPRFEDTDFSADIITSNINGTTRYRVALGAFESQEEATEYLTSLSDQLPEGSWLLQFDEDI